MAFKQISDLDATNSVSLGGFNKKTRKDNPTTAEGYYLGSKQVDSPKSKNGKAYLHILQTPKGNLGVWGKTDMDRKVITIPVGTMCRITHTGMLPTKNGEMYKYSVEVDTDNTIEVATTSKYANTEDEDTGYEGGTGGTEDEDEDTSTYEAPAPAMVASAESRKAKVQALLNKGKQ